ncbi:hypothetical protein AAHE18_10G092900 [Arachis hypogaea]|nr:uncharacterized protein DS421_10g298620 [Arachis hypogaea]
MSSSPSDSCAAAIDAVQIGRKHHCKDKLLLQKPCFTAVEFIAVKSEKKETCATVHPCCRRRRGFDIIELEGERKSDVMLRLRETETVRREDGGEPSRHCRV